MNAKKQPQVPTSRRRRWLRNLGEAVLLLALFLGLRAWTQRDVVKGPAPALSGLSTQGEKLALTAGKPTLVHFWATWCSVCNAEKGTVDALAKDHAVLSVAVDSGEASDVEGWMTKHGVRFPALLDDGALARAWGVRSFPTSFVVDGSGSIRFVEVGYTTELGLRARLWLAGRGL